MTAIRSVTICIAVLWGTVSACPDDSRETHTNEFLNHLLPGRGKGVLRSLVHQFLGNVHIQPINACDQDAISYLVTIRGAAGVVQNTTEDVQTRGENEPSAGTSVNHTNDQIETATELPQVDNRPTSINDIWSMLLPGRSQGFQNLVRKIINNVQIYPIYACDNGALTVLITFNGVKIVPPFRGSPPFQDLLAPISQSG